MKNFALAGNPNCGKTTLFNSLTGSTAHVGNWPGVTVDKKEGRYKKLDEEINIVDLPGIYSLSPYTPEEVISRNFIIEEKPDCVINVVDATNLERNLYLSTQILEIDVPVVIALNMNDLMEKEGKSIDTIKLEKELGVPVVKISALKGEGLKSLMEVAYKAAFTPRKGHSVIEDKSLLHLIEDVRIAFEGMGVASPLFHAIKLVGKDDIEVENHGNLVSMVDQYKANMEAKEDVDFESMIADARYKFISEKCSSALSKHEVAEEKLSKSDKIDKVLTHKIWAIPLFVVIMFFIFHFTFSEDLFYIGHIGAAIAGVPFDEFELIGHAGWVRFLSADYWTPLEELGGMNGIPSIGVFLQSWFGLATGSIITGFESFMPEGQWYTSLVIDGLLTGLDAVLSFIPQIMILFFFIAILEDSGYMARVAFILDRAFRKFGLSGKAFIPMLSGFGCSVPAIMATRTLEDEKEKNRTIRLITCFSCGAKAPIWALLATVGTLAGFAGDLFVFSIYLGGIAMAVIYALFMKIFSKDQYVSPFIMELPSYHMPQPRNVGALLWEKFKHYLFKAATIIAAATMVIWFLSYFGWGEDGKFQFLVFFDEEAGEYVSRIDLSILSYLGRGLRYFYYPLGCLPGGWTYGEDGWKYTVSTITGLIAKEQVVDTMAVLGLEEGTLSLSAAGVYSFAIYNLFTVPCFAAIGAAYGEQNRKQFWLTMLFWFAISYGTALVFYWLISLYEVAWWGGLLVTLALIGGIVFAGIYVTKLNKRKVLSN